MSDPTRFVSRSAIVTASEEYARLRVQQIVTGTRVNLPANLDEATSEIVHDAIMAAYQAGALSQSEGLTVTAAIERVA